MSTKIPISLLQSRIINPQKCVKRSFFDLISSETYLGLLAKTKIFGQMQVANFVKCLQKFFLIMVIVWKLDNILSGFFD